MFNLSENMPFQTILITGAANRIGRAMALALAKDGHHIALHYGQSEAAAQETLAQIIRNGGKAICIQSDLSLESDTASLIESATSALNAPLNILINNASTFEADLAQTHSRESWDFHMEVNLRAPVKLAQDFALHVGQTRKGLIINMIDQRVWKLNPTFFTYTLSKAALWTATQTLAQSFAPNIRVNAIGPGPSLANNRQSEADFARQREATLTQTGSPPDEIIKAVKFLIDSQAITGQMLAVDGGQHLIWQTPDVMGISE